ncbi:hypothetical protein [Colwellia sp. 12G3]|uniref:hypothetical protein n=1 Tax=Colwellia sp. 12G3 TaxID=2058299 RepID=UPI000C33B3D0|nr:hypothetical protein [Colwellia sp. 12G3]PKI15809.1 hypothetical protein CXF71_12440 [Colwellia sp. 12G3]
MSHDIAKRSFLAVLIFITFIVPLILVDEVSLLTNWLFIFISWFAVILLSAIPSSKTKGNNAQFKQTDDTLRNNRL